MRKMLNFILIFVIVFAMFGFLGCKAKDDRIELRLLRWSIGTEETNSLNLRMIKEFEKRNPEYRVTVVSEGSNYTDTMLSLAALQNVPDVMLMNSLPMWLSKEWALDITEYAEADEDWDKIPARMEEISRFNGRVMGVPAEMHLRGFFVNDTLFESKNKNTLNINPEFDDLYNAIKTNYGEGTAGLNNEKEFSLWYPSVKNEDMGWYTWNDDKKVYDLESQEFNDALKIMNDINSSRQSYSSWTPEEQEGSNVVEMFRKGKIATYYASTYERESILYHEGTEIIFEGDLRYIGMPGGKNIIIPDLWAIGKTSKHPEMAYELAKWMSFSVEGISKRLELNAADVAKGEKSQFTSLPLTNDETVLEEYFRQEEVAGLEEVFYTLDNAVVELLKMLPGFEASYATAELKGISYNAKIGDDTVARNNPKLDILYDDIWKGQINFSNWATYKTDVNNLANKSYENSVRALNNKYPQI